jgi:raffinose/stachyose/melibiose transport system substrate-binding protein
MRTRMGRRVLCLAVLLLLLLPLALSAQAKPVKLVMWWWGESEAPGMEPWVKETIKQFEAKNPNIQVETVLQGVDNVVGDFTTASGAGNPPDLQYFWNGTNHMENVWRGYIEPLNNVLTAAELKQMDATELSIYQGKQYRAGWYVVPFAMMYNKKLFAKAGVANPPEFWKWDDFYAACQKIKKAGITPMGFGYKDGWSGEWYTSFYAVQQVNDLQEIAKLISGESKWADPKNYEFWSRLERLMKAGFINDDANSLEHYQGIQLFEQGKVAMTNTVGSLLTEAEGILGAGSVGVVKFPVFSDKKYSRKAVEDIQGIGISSQSKHKKEAAEVIRFMHKPDRLVDMFARSNVFPADTTWNGEAQIKDPNLKLLWKWFKEGPAPYISNMLPWAFDEQVEFTAPQYFRSGTKSAADVGKLADEVMARWREENPQLFDGFKKWFNLK